MATDRIRFGTSGWQYADWRGVFYPAGVPQRLWLSTYADTFDTVEVNATFYRLPNETAVQKWTEEVPPGFVFAIKASRYLTHIKRLREPEEPVARLMSRIAPLVRARMLGPILLQLPPDMPPAPDLLDRTLGLFPAGVRVAVEPRHPGWFVAEVRRVLERRRAALVWADRNGRALSPLWETADWCYLRLHHGRHTWGYDRADLSRWARRLADRPGGFAFTNNDPGGAAVVDARRLRELVMPSSLRTSKDDMRSRTA